MTDTIKLKINNIPIEAPAGSTILEAARIAGIEIPTLCYMKGINAIGSCRICVVEVKGARTLLAACVYPASEGMEVFTNTQTVANSRRDTLELALSDHRMDCLTCHRNENCELQTLSKNLGIKEVRYGEDGKEPQIEASTPHLVRDNSKCVLCRRCVAVCKKQQEVSVIGINERGFNTHVGCAFGRDLAESPCVFCGQCITACPTGAIVEKDQTEEVWEALSDPEKHVVVGAAPSIRVTLGECFGRPAGTEVEGKMFASLRRLGFDGVFDLDTAADLTIVEEANELIERLKSGKNLPLITSCSPGWVSYAERYYPEFLENISSCKSPQQMFGAMMKTYYAKKKNIAPENIFVVSIIPCTAKKHETLNRDSAVEGTLDVDIALTTRELAAMIKRAGIIFGDLPNEGPDSAFGEASGAGHIFGTSGGVMEAALRTVNDLLSPDKSKNMEYLELRGSDGIKEAEYEIAGRKIKVAAVSGIANAKKLLDNIKNGAEYHFIEVMGCPGGCIGGGGQPIVPVAIQNTKNFTADREKALYSKDTRSDVRKSHDNSLIKSLYEDFLGEIGGERAHEILHTKLKPVKKYPGVDI